MISLSGCVDYGAAECAPHRFIQDRASGAGEAAPALVHMLIRIKPEQKNRLFP
jgi:hypothetical protein